MTIELTDKEYILVKAAVRQYMNHISPANIGHGAGFTKQEDFDKLFAEYQDLYKKLKNLEG